MTFRASIRNLQAAIMLAIAAPVMAQAVPPVPAKTGENIPVSRFLRDSSWARAPSRLRL